MTGYIYKILGIETIKIYTSEFAIKKQNKNVYMLCLSSGNLKEVDG